MSVIYPANLVLDGLFEKVDVDGPVPAWGNPGFVANGSSKANYDFKHVCPECEAVWYDQRDHVCWACGETVIPPWLCDGGQP